METRGTGGPRRRARLPLAVAVPVAIALAALVTLGLGACGGEAGEEVSTLERIREEGAVRIGYANEAPYAYLDPATGQVTGEAPEIARRLFAELGVDRVEGVLTEFGSLIPGLQAGRFDVIAAGMYITPERCEQIAFTDPTYGIGEALVVATGNPLDLHAYEEVAAHDEARLGVVAGTVELGYARAVGIPEERIVLFPDPPSALAGVQSGRVDAYGGTRLTVRRLLETSGQAAAQAGGSSGLEAADPFTDPVVDGESVRGYGAFGLRRDDEALRAALDEQLDAFLGSDEHLALVEPFGFTAEDLPGEAATAAALCEP